MTDFLPALRPNLLPDRPATRPKLSEQEIGAILGAAAQAKSENTRKAYSKVMRKLLRWLNRYHPECIREAEPWPHNFLPLHPETLAAFLTGVRIDPPKGGDPEIMPRPTVSTLAQYLCAIRAAHDHYSLPDPSDDPVVSAAWAGMRRELGVRQRGSDPLLREALHLAVLSCDAAEDPDRAARDRALLLVGFYGAFRRSELASLRIRDMSTDDAGLLLDLARSKTDQEGRGVVVEIPRLDNEEFCPVAALEAWRLVLDRLDGGVLDGERPLFRGWTWQGVLRRTPMSGEGVNFVVQRVVERAGLEGRLSAHSLRSGFATSASEAKVELDALMAQGRWKTAEMALRYIRRRHRGADNAAAQVGNRAGRVG